MAQGICWIGVSIFHTHIDSVWSLTGKSSSPECALLNACSSGRKLLQVTEINAKLRSSIRSSKPWSAAWLGGAGRYRGSYYDVLPRQDHSMFYLVLTLTLPAPLFAVIST